MDYVLGYNLQFDKRTGQNKYQQLQKKLHKTDLSRPEKRQGKFKRLILNEFFRE